MQITCKHRNMCTNLLRASDTRVIGCAPTTTLDVDDKLGFIY